jgi:hypothetical protein
MWRALVVLLCAAGFFGLACGGNSATFEPGDGLRRGNTQGFDLLYPNDSGTFAFVWRDGPVDQKPVQVQVLEVVDLSDQRVVYRNAGTYRSRDVNVAAWSSTPNVLIAYSGDVGTALVAPTSNGPWARVEGEACLDKNDVEAVGQVVVDRIPTC